PADDVIVYSIKGEVRHRLNRDALFDEKARKEFYVGDNYVVWLRSAWIDERRDEIVIVGSTRSENPSQLPMITVALASGQVRPIGADVVDRAIAERIHGGISQALELARELK